MTAFAICTIVVVKVKDYYCFKGYSEFMAAVSGRTKKAVVNEGPKRKVV